MIEQVMDKDKNSIGVCILGMWYGINYGSILTSYALYAAIKGLGYNPVMASKPGRLWNDTYYEPNSIAQKFAAGRMPTTPVFARYAQYATLNIANDIFVTGCDALWNYPLVDATPTFFYQDFVESGKRQIAYATSFGREFKLPRNIHQRISECLRSFDRISCREDEGVKTCQELYGIEAERTLDPVFLHDAEFYISLASGAERPEKYVLSYILDPNPDKRKAILLISENLGYPNINIPDANNVADCAQRLGLPVEKDISVEDWLQLFACAEFIVTDSFHGLCFALIFGKPFVCFANPERGITRFWSLLRVLKLERRLALDLDDFVTRIHDFLSPVDYETVNAILAGEKARSLAWLKNALSAENTGIDKSIARLEEKLCCGCGACANLCSEHAIQMIRDAKGFWRARVNAHKCVNCGICAKRCITLNPLYQNSSEPECHAVMANDEIRKVSSSGGFFTVAAEYVLEQGGYVCGAIYTADFQVEHILISELSELAPLRGSKYMQSRTDTLLPQIRDLLERGAFVLFCGTPCQAGGLKAFLGKDYDGLVTLDLVCHGITSSLVFEKYHRDVFGGKKITDLKFKAKEPWGWHANINATFADGERYSVIAEKDPFFRAYLSGLSKNDACPNCTANHLPRQGDLTIGDFWKINTVDSSLDDGKGTSLVLVNSAKGADFLAKIRPAFKHVIVAPLQTALAGNPSLKHSYPLSRYHDIFFSELDSLPFAELVDGCLANRLYERKFMRMRRDVPPEDMEFYLIAAYTAQHFRGRKLALWLRSEKFEKILGKYFGLRVEIGITGNKSIARPGSIEELAWLNGKSAEYYLVALDPQYDEGIYRRLADFGYQPGRDFIFRRLKPVVLKDHNLAGAPYFDEFGNSIEGRAGLVGSITFRGFNNHLLLEERIAGSRFISVDTCANSRLEIGAEASFRPTARFRFSGYEYETAVKIGAQCRFGDFQLVCFPPASAILGRHCTFGNGSELHINMGHGIIAGDDCMFSYNVELWAGDGHAIFDVTNGQCINRGKSGSWSKAKYLVLGEHVWVGKGALLLNGANMGNGSIVGSRAVVKGTFPNNCVIAGNPAREIRRNAAWSRNGNAADISACGEPEYVAPTSRAAPPVSGKNVLVAGGTRFMGLELVRRLLELGNHVTIATRGLSPDPFGMSIERLIVNIEDAADCASVLAGRKYDVIFDDLAYASNNVRNILANVACDRYIQLSSIMVYENLKPGLCENNFRPERQAPLEGGRSASYASDKRRAEIMAFSRFPEVSAVAVRLPSVARTDRLFWYCKNVVSHIPMNIADPCTGFAFVRASEVGRFLPWIAAQPFSGPVNFASEGSITIKMLLDYITARTGISAILDSENGEKQPFQFKNAFSLNLDKIRNLGWRVSSLDDWFWELMDEYITRALKDKK